MATMGIIVQRDRYDEAICERCGHTAGYHDTGRCLHPVFSSSIDLGAKPPCTCTGWRRDLGWPPPIIVKGELA